jgi:Sulfotransferase domain
MRIHFARGGHREALRELRTSIFADAELPALFWHKMQILTGLWRFDEARAAFALYLQHAIHVESLEILFVYAPLIHEGWRLTEIRTELLQRLDQLTVPSAAEDTTTVIILRARIKLALRDHNGFQVAAGGIDNCDTTDKFVINVRSVAAAMTEPRFPNFYKPKIFGIGLSKTGTTTLAAALTTLGLNTLHWTNPLTNELISEADLHLFDAFTDLPFCTSFERYFHMFPNAKFIYTTRPIESWLDSFTRKSRQILNISGFDQIKEAFARDVEFQYGSYFREIYFQLFVRHPSATEAYMSYDQRVRDFFRGERQEKFLEFSVFNGDGWPKLCRFLNTDVPNVPFPFENRAPG